MVENSSAAILSTIFEYDPSVPNFFKFLRLSKSAKKEILRLPIEVLNLKVHRVLNSKVTYGTYRILNVERFVK